MTCPRESGEVGDVSSREVCAVDADVDSWAGDEEGEDGSGDAIA